MASGDAGSCRTQTAPTFNITACGKLIPIRGIRSAAFDPKQLRRIRYLATKAEIDQRQQEQYTVDAERRHTLFTALSIVVIVVVFAVAIVLFDALFVPAWRSGSIRGISRTAFLYVPICAGSGLLPAGLVRIIFDKQFRDDILRLISNHAVA